MSKLDQSGIATVAVVVALIAVTVTTAGVSIAADGMELPPDNPIYALGRIGERIREPFQAGQDFDIQRVERRRSEFLTMVERDKAEEYMGILTEAEDRLDSAIGRIIQSPVNMEKLEKAIEAVNVHISTLDNVYENVPDQAKPALSLSIERSVIGSETLANIETGELTEGDDVRNRLQTARREILKIRERVRSEIRERKESGESIGPVVHDLEIEISERIISRIPDIAQNHADHTEVAERQIGTTVDIVGSRIDSAINNAGHDQGLNRARKAIDNHIEIIENVYENVPDQAKPALSLSIERSARCIEVIEDVKAEGLDLPIGAEMRNRIRNAKNEARSNLERNRTRLREGEFPKKVVQDVEISITERLTQRFAGAPERYTKHVRIIESRLNAASRAAGDNQGLERAIDASKKVLSTLENVSERLPENAKPAVERAKERVSVNVGILENIRLGPPEEIADRVRDNIKPGPPADREPGPPWNEEEDEEENDKQDEETPDPSENDERDREEGDESVDKPDR